MDSQDEAKYDERLLVRYLLGTLSREETERLDELSIVDDDFASRLTAAENDLVDAYVKKELSERDSEKFASAYLSSAKRRQKVEFAETLLAFERTAKAQLPVAETTPAPESPSVPAAAPQKRFPSRVWLPRLAFAAVAVVLLLAAGYLFRENRSLHRQMNDAQGRQQQLEQQIAQQHATNAEILNQLEQARASQSKLDQLQTVTLLLLPPTRGASQIPVLAVRPGIDLAVLLLAVETDDFPVYRAVLKDPAANSIVWRSPDLQAYKAGDKKTVSISFQAALLKQQNYIVELTGVPAKGTPEPAASYPLRVVLK